MTTKSEQALAAIRAMIGRVRSAEDLGTFRSAVREASLTVNADLQRTERELAAEMTRLTEERRRLLEALEILTAEMARGVARFGKCQETPIHKHVED